MTVPATGAPVVGAAARPSPAAMVTRARGLPRALAVLVIQPWFMGDAVGLSVTVTFLALVFWAWLLGPLGAILAIPLTLLAKGLVVDIDPRAKRADALLRASAEE